MSTREKYWNCTVFTTEQNRIFNLLLMILFDLCEDLKSGSRIASIFLTCFLKDLNSLTLNSPAVD